MQLYAAETSIQIPKEFWGKNIHKIQFYGLRKVESEALLEKVISIPGKVLSEENLRNDLKTLYKMKYFEDVIAKAQSHESGVILNIELKEKPIIRNVKIDGNEEEDEEELKKQIKTNPFGIIDINLLNQDIVALQKYYEDFMNSTASLLIEQQLRVEEKKFYTERILDF